MFQNSEPSSHSDHTFNFNYQLQIKTQKSANSQVKQKYTFHDFPDLRDQSNLSRTISQSNQNQRDSFMFISNRSSKTNKNGWINKTNLMRSKSPSDMNTVSPKFIKDSDCCINTQINVEQIGQNSKNESNSNNGQNKENRQKVLEDNRISCKQIYQINQQSLIRQYQCQIKYLNRENDLIDYQCIKISRQISELISHDQHQNNQKQLQQLQLETQKINLKIKEKIQIEKMLIQQKQFCIQQFSKICQQFDNMNFSRPKIVKDEAVALIAAINNSNNQFQALRNQTTNLNLFQTQRVSNLPSIQRNFLQISNSNISQKQSEQSIFQDLISSIQTESLRNRDPSYIRNIKYSIIKDQWQLYQNQNISVNFKSKNYPLLNIYVGNRSCFPLQNLSINENGIQIIRNQTLMAKKYYNHEIRVNKFMKPFTQLCISYSINQKQQKLSLFLPTMPLKFGEFLPITSAQFQTEYQFHKNKLKIMTKNSLRNLDLQIIPQYNIQAILSLYPNLIVDGNKIKGIFQLWNNQQGALIILTKKSLNFQIQIVNSIPFLSGSIEFLFGSI